MHLLINTGTLLQAVSCDLSLFPLLCFIPSRFSRCMIRPLVIHSIILQKYRKECSTDKINNNNIDSVVQEEGRDEFYDVLRTRVTNALLERGVDPVSDRGATPLRTAYYILILCFWLASGYSHIMVSVFPAFPRVLLFVGYPSIR